TSPQTTSVGDYKYPTGYRPVVTHPGSSLLYDDSSTSLQSGRASHTAWWSPVPAANASVPHAYPTANSRPGWSTAHPSERPAADVPSPAPKRPAAAHHWAGDSDGG